jgi:hypothetical protein
MTGIRADRTPTVRVIAASVPTRRRQPATPTALLKQHTSGNGHAAKAAREGRTARAPAARRRKIRRLPPTVSRSD